MAPRGIIALHAIHDAVVIHARRFRDEKELIGDGELDVPECVVE